MALVTSITDETKIIGEKVKQCRLNSRMTQEVAASLCGISKKTFIKIEKGGDVYLSTLLQVFKTFGITWQLETPPMISSQVENVNGGQNEWF